MARDLDFYLKWLATGIIILATIATAFDFVPINKVLLLIGCALWGWVGWIWRQPSIWALNLFCGIVYILGLLK
jgi:hypothetical protein